MEVSKVNDDMLEGDKIYDDFQVRWYRPALQGNDEQGFQTAQFSFAHQWPERIMNREKLLAQSVDTRIWRRRDRYVSHLTPLLQ